MNEKTGESTIVLRMYAAFSASLVMTFIPMAIFAGLAMVLFIGVLMAAYHLRDKAGDGGLVENHMTFIIRTIWIVSLFGVFTILAGTAYLIPLIDYAPMDPCMYKLMNALDMYGDLAAMEKLCEPDIRAFITANMNALITATVISGGPLVIYLVYRLAKGLSRALKGYRIQDPKGWF